MSEKLRNPEKYLLEELLAPRPEVVVVTGGPAGGKTTILNTLRALSEYSGRPTIVLPEVPTLWMHENGKSLGDLAKNDRPAYLQAQREIALMKIALHEEAKRELAGTNGLIAEDRGRADEGAYLTAGEHHDLASSLGHKVPELCHNFADKVVFIRSLGVSYPQIYDKVFENNDIRYENAQEAAETDMRTLNQWRCHPELHIIDSDDEQIKVIRALNFVTGEDNEYEKKWAVKSSEIAQAKVRSLGDKFLNEIFIVQSYHEHDGQKFRLRKGLGSDNYTFYQFSVKVKTQNGNTELLRQLSSDQYELLARTSSRLGELKKIRDIFYESGQVWHLDEVFSNNGESTYLLETEVSTPGELVNLKPIIPALDTDFNTEQFASEQIAS